MPSLCTISKGRKLPCKSAFGGIKNVYFMDFGNISALAQDIETCEFSISYVTPVIDWFKFEIKGSSSLDSAVTSSRDNGTTFYTQTLNLTLTYLDACTQEQLQKAALGRPNILVEDYYGNVFLLGRENGCELTSGQIQTGAAAGDLSGFTLVFEAMEETAPLFISTLPLNVSTSDINPTS
jgi:hypothetical protein|tara:strand:+ start:628 stop:1167 length:540 start_codon:yes stop_codon:yes gene_type:complete